jgi:hypothetical protein
VAALRVSFRDGQLAAPSLIDNKSLNSESQANIDIQAIADKCRRLEDEKPTAARAPY